ncbi:MAG: methyltransferase [Myxococcota bacterium]|jgi:tRNA1(Val) A37 N6-methylase TrmN6|nr:methyltransferase [Myxococcota bacterium]
MTEPVEVGSGDELVESELTLDRLVGGWHLFQLQKGHRFSTDDMITAWAGVRARPGAVRVLDLGAGIGSAGLQALWHLGEAARLTQVEAQAISHQLARRSIRHNGLQARVRSILGDLRDEQLGLDESGYDLVLGTPPYLPAGTGVCSPYPQRAGARMELRGNIFDYCRAAVRYLAPDGCFSFCHAGGDPRPRQAVEEVGLSIHQRIDVIFRSGKPPTIRVFVCGRERRTEAVETLVIRNAEGRWTGAYQALREDFAGVGTEGS